MKKKGRFDFPEWSSSKGPRGRKYWWVCPDGYIHIEASKGLYVCGSMISPHDLHYSRLGWRRVIASELRKIRKAVRSR